MDFPSFLMDLRGSGVRMSAARWQPVASWKALCHPVAPDWIPLYSKISDSGGLDLESWCLDAWMLKDWNGLEEVTEVTAFCREGIGRTSHTLELQKLGGFLLGSCTGVIFYFDMFMSLACPSSVPVVLRQPGKTTPLEWLSMYLVHFVQTFY